MLAGLLAGLALLAPVASAGGPYSITEGESVRLDAGASSDGDNRALTYGWDIDGDGDFDDASGVAPSATWAQLVALGLGDGPMDARVRVRVANAVEHSISVATTLRVENAAPAATLSSSGPLDEGETATVAFADVSDPSAADAAAPRYAYDFDSDGNWDLGGDTYASATTLAAAALPRALTADGPVIRNVHAAVLDRDGGRAILRTMVTVRNVAPVAVIDGPVSTTGTVTLTLRAGDTPADDLTLVVVWGDGSREVLAGARERVVSHSYARPGAYIVALVVRDDDGAQSTVAYHPLSVTAATAAARPAATAQAVSGLSVSPRCSRAPRAALARALRVRFRLAAAGPVEVRLERRAGTAAGAWCPPRGTPGRYTPQLTRSFRLRAGVHTLPFPAAPRPGSYRLTVTAGGSSERVLLASAGSARR